MYQRMRTAIGAVTLSLAMLAPALTFAQQPTFHDIGSVPWAAQAIQAMEQEGVMQGTGPGTFSPGSDLTRAQMATVLGRFKHWQPAAQGTTPAFADAQSIPAWSMPYVATAAQQGILQGMPNGDFAPQGTLTWADLAIIVARAFNYPTVPQAGIAGLLAQLVNGPQTPTYAQQAVAEDVQAGDFAGILAELYSPNKPTSRAELALFLDQAASGTSTAPSGIASLAMAPTPIAAAGSLTASQTVTISVAADTASGNPVAGGTVYLSFSPATGGGSASVNGTALTATPAAFTTGSTGTVAVTYTAPATLPTSGSDTLTVANAASSPTVSATDSYSFGTATQVSGATVGELQITVTTASGQTATYPLAPNVTVTKDGQPSTLAAIAAGDVVNLTLNSQGQVTAVDIQSAPSTGAGQ